MKCEEVVGILGPFQVDTALEDWYLYPMWTSPDNRKMARWNDCFDILGNFIHRELGDLQGDKNESFLSEPVLLLSQFVTYMHPSNVAQHARNFMTEHYSVVPPVIK